ncbi:hypothetical protein PCASD_20257 [Puccinia coronata f. sp. avenae]|uniref:Alpha/beta hydrolase fold-3 domain-containing protein n=1 Tax=Puccinia coronata f. sp. avenae TaxID=200324 RepID=A0A2N5S8M3_9BASI|nr:hypothetical protein PCASD_20257 [Puccinia coronata f. sp. avenae]
MSAPLLPLNGLTVCYMALPTVVGTFFRHILPSQDSDPSNRSELKADEALAVARTVAQKFTHYPVEDVQRLANTFQPAPPSVRVIRVSISASTCSSAAEYLIAAFGPDELRNLIGGKQWWQLRGNKDGSVEGEWIAMKRDLPRSPSSHSMSPSPSKRSPSSSGLERGTSHSRSLDVSGTSRRRSIFGSLRRRQDSPPHPSLDTDPTPSADSAPEPTRTDEENLPHLAPSLDPGAHQSHFPEPNSSSCEDEVPSDHYEDDLDKMPCMLYIHGGAYYFGSVNTHRYTIWRYARKMGGRAFAVNYRLAPQYPFPCALADCLAAYLYLIRPPENAKHRMIDPSKIVIAGDSAGGGLSLALLTLIRDVGLPMPAGAVLISPWVDLTHSFPSIMTNSDKDIIPPYGFMHQPSVLWPPPALKTGAETASPAQSVPAPSQALPSTSTQNLNPFKLKLSSELKIRTDQSDNSTNIIELKDGELVKMDQQIQLYATNDQLAHPYCSPLFSPSLGGLPPLLILAGDNEVLRDEIIYLAHRAAHPDRYPLREDLLNAHPERKAKGADYAPTKVHLQVYDDMFHVLPMFSFLRPAKYCYRSIGSFCKFVTGLEQESGPDPASQSRLPSQDERRSAPSEADTSGAPSSPANPPAATGSTDTSQVVTIPSTQAIFTSEITSPPAPLVTPPSSPLPGRRSAEPKSGRRLSRLTTDAITRRAALSESTLAELEHTIYHASLPFRRPPFAQNMIRERVAVDGRIRPLEDEADIAILKLAPDDLGIIKDGPLRRWAEGRKLWDHKFIRRYKKIQAQREHHIKRSNQRVKESIKKQTEPQMTQKKSRKKKLGRRTCLGAGAKEKKADGSPADAPPRASTAVDSAGAARDPSEGGPDAAVASPVTPLGWTLSTDENPPPSSIAARIDTSEALKLAKVLEHQHQSKHHLRR